MSSQPKRIAIQRADKLGDVVLILPVIDAIKKKYPESEIIAIVSAIGAEFLEGHPHIHQQIVVNWDNNQKLCDPTDLETKLRFANCDIYIALWNNYPLAKIARKAEIAIRIGDSTNIPEKWLYTHPIRQVWEDYTRHQIEFNLDLLQPLQIEPELKKGRVPIDKVSQKKWVEWFKEHASHHRQIVTIFHGTGGSNHPIPRQSITQFAQHLIDTGLYQIVLIGQVKNEDEVSQFKGEFIHNLINQTSLKDIVTIISLSDFYVGPDTGPTQIASQLNRPMIFFSSMKPNPPIRWGPMSDYFKIIRNDYSCPYVCVKKCHPDECFKFATAERLKATFGELIADIQVSEKKSPNERKNIHFLNSMRVLVLATNKYDYDTYYEAAKKSRDAQLMIFPYCIDGWTIKSLIQSIKYVIKHNVTLIQGDIPWWFRKCIQLYMGAIIVYQPPKYASFALNKAITPSECIALYKKVSKNR